MGRAATISPRCVGRKGSAADMQRAGSLGHRAGLTSLPGVRSADLGDCGNVVRAPFFVF